jgi:hypothetical protein
MCVEHFFSPTRRLQYICEENGDQDDDPFPFTELALAVSLEDFLNHQWGWNDLLAFASDDVMDKILWITIDAFLVIKNDERDYFDYDELGCFIEATVQESSGREQKLMVLKIGLADIPVLSTRELGVFWHAIMTSSSVKVSLDNGNHSSGMPGPLLSQFLRESPSLRSLDFRWFNFEEEHCRAIATLERTDIEVTLIHCTLEAEDAEDIFIESFRHNQVVSELDSCNMDSNFLCAFSGNNSVKKLTIDTCRCNFCGEEQMRSLAKALTGNTGIEHLAVKYLNVTEEAWSLFFHSLATHPRIKHLLLSHSLARMPGYVYMSAKLNTARMNGIIPMLQRNTVVQTIELLDGFEDEEVYRNSILPRLEMNRSCFEVQRQAVKRADPSIRPQLLGRALHVVRYNPELVFLFLSENVPAFVRTEEVVGEMGDSTILSLLL